tara:strand:- start:554 stop:1129 length:576 start_codon:yes stop_codon:yes gene_type:complete
MKERIVNEILESANIKRLICEDNRIVKQIEECAKNCIDALSKGGKIIFCGNGGSFSDSQHLSAELIGRFAKDRDPLASIALGTNTSSLSAIGNDLGYKYTFSRELEAIGNKKDFIIALSTSGNSNNIIELLNKAKSLKIKSLLLTGKKQSRASKLSESIFVPSLKTARIQECHIMIGQIVCGIIEDEIFPS